MIPPPEFLGAFAIAALVLLLIPGPAVLYIVTRTATQGLRAGIASMGGLATGTLVHIAAAAAGLSVVLATSVTAFQVVKFAGAAYLIYLGIQKFRRKDGAALQAAPPQRYGRIYFDGIVVSLLNPKSALFFLAFLPQFVAPERGSPAIQVLVLGATFLLLSFVTDFSYAMLAGWLRPFLLGTATRAAWPQYLAGTIYVILGVAAALTDARGTVRSAGITAGGN